MEEEGRGERREGENNRKKGGVRGEEVLTTVYSYTHQVEKE